MFSRFHLAAMSAVLFALPVICAAQDAAMCTYTDKTGRLVVVNGRAKVPAEFVSGSRCVEGRTRPVQPVQPEVSLQEQRSMIEALRRELVGEAGPPPPSRSVTAGPAKVMKGGVLVGPNEIALKGTLREEQLNTSLGSVHVRWPRAAETLFGRTPLRALNEATTAVSRALKRPGFPPELQTLSQAWEVVFMDGEPPSHQVPAQLANLCHPAWMTPPANIYVVAQRIAGKCPGQKNATPFRQADADIMLARTLVHEFGHVVENILLGGNMGSDSMRAEGFASWFEAYGSDLTTVVPKGSAKAHYVKLAQQSVKESPNQFIFDGSGPAYGRASLSFHAIVSRRGVAGLMKVYETMRTNGLPYTDAVRATIGWDDATLNKETLKVMTER